MRLLLKLAWRNIGRNRKSTLLNGIGIAFSAGILLFILFLSRGIESQIVGRSIQFETGALSIVFTKEITGMERAAEGTGLFEEVRSVLDGMDEVEHYYPRIYPTHALLYAGDYSRRVNVTGLTDREIPLIPDRVRIEEGRAELTDGRKGIVISNGLAEDGQLKVGDLCTLLLQSADGTINMDDYTVEGVFRYTSQLDKYEVYMNYEEAKALYNSNLPSALLVGIRNWDRADALKKDLLTSFGYTGADVSGEKEWRGMKISCFNDHLGRAKSLSAINKYSMLGLAAFLVLLSFVGIWSMQVENIQVRRREIGSLLSFGFPIASVKKIFLYESLYISLFAFCMGLAVVALSMGVINRQEGLYLGESASFAFGSAIVNPVGSVSDVVLTLGIAVIYPLLATFISLQGMGKAGIMPLLHSN